MAEFLTFMAAPFAACLVLVGIHAYLGIHVLAREVIFVDLALAQIAALGITLGFLFGFGLESRAAYVFSLGAVLLGAALFALTRMREARIPQEAVIGIVYVVSAAAGVLVLDSAPHGAEHLKAMLVGQILWVTWPEVWRDIALYSLVGAFHWFARARFLAISFDEEEARRQGWSLRLWDFLFYASFGFVITISVPIAGVLLVFTFLIVPAVCAALLVQDISARLTVAWALGFVVSAVGCSLSYVLDLPTGATVVCAFGVALALVSLLRSLTGAGTGRAPA
jgi:zinc/manganese transport system permease protein